VDPVVVEVVRKAPVWTRQWWRQCGIEVSAEEEQACDGGGAGSIVKEEERRRRLRSVVAVAEASPYTGAVAMAGRMVQFPGAATTWRWTGRWRCGPDDSGGDRGGAIVDSVASRSMQENLVACRRQVQII
jgi:hypothetical protein